MLMQEYMDKVEQLISTVRETQSDSIHEAAMQIAPRIANGGILYAFGTGHSHVLAEEIAGRAGGLVQTKALIPYDLTMDPTPNRTMLMERMDGLADVIFETTQIREKDVLIIISNSGRNSVPVQMALGAKERGIFAIALTNVAHSKSVSSRDKSNKKLYEVCDIVLDICGVPGDAIVQPEGKPWSTGPISTIAGSFILQSMMCDIMDILLSDGTDPVILQSMNLDGNDEYNKNAVEGLHERYPELKFLLRQ